MMTEKEIKILISGGESETLEFKKTTSMLKEAVETVVAFANSNGGYLFFGISDSGDVIGQDVSDSTLKNIANTIKLNTEPKIYPNISKVNINGKDCILLIIDESPLKPHLAYGRPFVRTGPANHKLDREQYEHLLMQRYNGYGFDYLTQKNATIDDIDTVQLYEFVETANSIRNLNENLYLPPETILEKLDLIKKNKLTNAALLLFGKNPTQFFLGHYEVKCGHFIDDNDYDNLLNDKEFKGNLLSNFGFIYSFLVDSLRTSSQKTNIVRNETTEFPESVLREAIVNMIVHRDYRQDIKSTIEVRPKKVILANPAHIFRPSISIEALTRPHPSRPGNKLIAKIFYMMGLFENWGGGTLHIINQTVKSGKKEPEFSFNDGIFKLEFER